MPDTNKNRRAVAEAARAYVYKADMGHRADIEYRALEEALKEWDRND